jgi:monoamine oxidase
VDGRPVSERKALEEEEETAAEDGEGKDGGEIHQRKTTSKEIVASLERHVDDFFKGVEAALTKTTREPDLQLATLPTSALVTMTTTTSLPTEPRMHASKVLIYFIKIININLHKVRVINRKRFIPKNLV